MEELKDCAENDDDGDDEDNIDVFASPLKCYYLKSEAVDTTQTNAHMYCFHDLRLSLITISLSGRERGLGGRV